ncbi:MAG: preprotein translocase subunit SecG [Candidatus Eisenbacteria bacterium]|nr:preprotein translocase subunit SecG [Candidatus Eisenbacteria bacterium]
MFAFLLVLHLLITAALVIVILLQSGKGGGLAGAFGGGGGSQTIFGGRGAATFLSRSTAVLGAAFMLTSMSLALLTTRGPVKRERSVIENVIRKERASQPAQTPQGGVPSGSLPAGRVPLGQTPIGGSSQSTSPAGTQSTVTPGTGQVAPGAGVVPSQTAPAAGTTQPTQQKKPTGTSATGK